MFESCFTDCAVELVELLSRKVKTARKPHKCGECGHMIQPGQRYEVDATVFDGDFATHKTCIVCRDVRDSLFTRWIYTQIWEDIHQEYCVHGDDAFCICPQPANAKEQP